MDKGAADHSSSIKARPTSAPVRAAARSGLIAWVFVMSVAAIVGLLAAGMAGLWGGLLGSFVGGGFSFGTAYLVDRTAKSSPVWAGAVLLGGWIIKVLAALVIVFVLKSLDFFHHQIFGIAAVVGVAFVLAAEVRAVLRQKVPYVDTK